MKSLTLLVVSLALTFPTQTNTLDTGPRSDTKATVYVYKTRHAKTLGRITFPFIFDEKEVARLDSERFFVMLVEPGRHIARSKNKRDGGVEVDMRAGGVYFLKMSTKDGATVGSPSITIVPPEEGSFTARQMKPIKESDIKDSALILMDLVERKKN